MSGANGNPSSGHRGVAFVDSGTRHLVFVFDRDAGILRQQDLEFPALKTAPDILVCFLTADAPVPYYVRVERARKDWGDRAWRVVLWAVVSPAMARAAEALRGNAIADADICPEEWEALTKIWANMAPGRRGTPRWTRRR